jgi:DNA-directed RNA polymerase subunit H (RpoH/RPB5)
MGLGLSMAWYKAPKHEVLSATQAKKELKLLDIAVEELPLIKIGDAALVDLSNSGVSVIPGDIIRVSRNSNTGGEGFRYYRKVIQ